MIPSEAHTKLATRLKQWHTADPEADFAIGGNFVNELRALTIRLGDADTMSADERRDWMNLLNLRLTDHTIGL